jgi:S-disulfanyl-L-cysteine oxidoreductase SoxD
MKIAVIVATLVGFTATAAFRSSAGVQLPASKTASAASASRSVWDGVYTEAQQKRGAAIYARECSTCHGEMLKGGEGAPPLSGSDFTANWNDQTVADLFEKIRLTMPAPPEQPGKLTPQQNADVITHILSVNNFPAGPTELSTDLEQLKRIRITTSKP